MVSRAVVMKWVVVMRCAVMRRWAVEGKCRGWGGACGPARVAISSSTAEVRSSKLPVACPRRGPHV